MLPVGCGCRLAHNVLSFQRPDVETAVGHSHRIFVPLLLVLAMLGCVGGGQKSSNSQASLTAILVAPGNAKISAGTAQQFTATGRYSDASTRDLTSSVTWKTSAPSVGVVSPSGMLSGVKPGTTKVIASSGAISGASDVIVTMAAIVALTIRTVNPSIAKLTTEQFSAIAQFSDGTQGDVTSRLAWSSSNPSVAAVDGGLAFGVAPGAATITASSGSVRGSTSLTVTNATVVTITLTPTNPSLVVGTFQQFTATGTFSDNSKQVINGVAKWLASSPSVANTNAAGLVTALSVGSTTISATFENVTGNSSVSVRAPSLISVSITPTTPSIAATTQENFFVLGHYDDGSTQVLTNATWSSSDSAVATMNGNTAVSHQPGVTTISASVNNGQFQTSTTLTVTSATLQSIAVT